MAPDEIRTVLIPNRTFLVRFGSISGSFGLTMGILRIYLNFAAPRPREISEALLYRQCALNSASMQESYCFVGVKNMSQLYPEYGIKMKEIKVAEINASLN